MRATRPFRNNPTRRRRPKPLPPPLALTRGDRCRVPTYFMSCEGRKISHVSQSVSHHHHHPAAAIPSRHSRRIKQRMKTTDGQHTPPARQTSHSNPLLFFFCPSPFCAFSSVLPQRAQNFCSPQRRPSANTRTSEIQNKTVFEIQRCVARHMVATARLVEEGTHRAMPCSSRVQRRPDIRPKRTTQPPSTPRSLLAGVRTACVKCPVREWTLRTEQSVSDLD